jgi:SAM-dependent methyltransferase
MSIYPGSGGRGAPGVSAGHEVRYYKKDFWSKENLKFSRPHFRMRKLSHIVRRIAGTREVDLLDVGCGPGTLMYFLPWNMHYYGIDIAIQDPAPNLREADLLQEPVRFGARKFDIVLAQGFFEYMGEHQDEKLAEIRQVLKGRGRFITTYVNFGHRNKSIYWPYSNIQPMADFRRSVSRQFRIDRSFPTSHNWGHSEPNRWFMQASQMHLNLNIPVISPMLAVEYVFVCSLPGSVTARHHW